MSLMPRLGLAGLAVCLVLIWPPTFAVSAADRPAAGPLEIDGLVFAVPSTWQAVPPGSAIRRAEFRVAGEKRGPGRAVFYRFPAGAGGSPEANITRWYRQFVEPRDELDAVLAVAGPPGRRRFVFRAFGTLIGSGPDGQPVEVPDYGFLGAMVETPVSMIFVRVVAPAAVIRRDDPAFREMIAAAADSGD